MKEVVFVADMFLEDYVGGAELTTDAFIQSMPEGVNVSKIHCTNLTVDFLKSNNDTHFIICNFASLRDEVKLTMCKDFDYSIVEYDYKFCKYRSMKKHEIIEKKACDCVEQMHGKINSAFYGYAQRVWFMSHGQKDIFLSKIEVLKEERCEVIGSAFSEDNLRFMESIKDNKKDDTYVILGSESWIKGTRQCIEYAKKNNLKFEIVKNIQYRELLNKMSRCKGLIFQPLDYDTCPRIVIEAKLLGCELKLNKYVQHKDENWFADQENCYIHLKNRTEIFWRYYV
jgi:hypothetical protein